MDFSFTLLGHTYIYIYSPRPYGRATTRDRGINIGYNPSLSQVTNVFPFYRQPWLKEYEMCSFARLATPAQQRVTLFEKASGSISISRVNSPFSRMDCSNSGSILLKMALSYWGILSSGIRSPNPFTAA